MSAPYMEEARSLPKLRASIVTPTHNRCASLERVLCALGEQTVPPSQFEVVLVADGCDDDTVPRCKMLQAQLPYRLRLIEQVNTGPAAARNRAVAEASAPLIVFIDDDVIPDPSWLEQHLAAHDASGDDMLVVIGPLLPPLNQRLNAWGAWEEHTLCDQYAAMSAGQWQPTYRQFYTGNASLARRHILDAGGFNAAFLRAEDIELGLRLKRLGCRFAFVESARAWHHVWRSFASWARMPVAYGRATVAIGRAHEMVNVENAATEYLNRNAPTRACVQLCLKSPRRIRWMTRALHGVAVLLWALRLQPAAFISCGILYNLRYYAGFAEEIGGVDVFWHLIETARTAPPGGGPQSALTMLVAQLLGRPLPAVTPQSNQVEMRVDR
ncbi:MAG: glycosyltransferase [Ktedonobacterales bacterium]